MRTFFFRALSMLDALWLKLRAMKGSGAPADTAGRPPSTMGAGRASPTAGAGVQAAGTIGARESGGVWWPEFPTLAHSFWRSQELTLFKRHLDLLREPVLDLGCGDCLFAELAGFPGGALGTDLDAGSLLAARRRSSRPLVLSDARKLPVKSGSIAVCVSNSVLEHLPDLDLCLAEAARVLRPGGLFLFSMTLGTFTTQLTRLGGAADAGRWIARFGHLQQPTGAELAQMLGRGGFAVQTTIDYQPLEDTALYRALVSPVFQFFERRAKAAVDGWLRPRLLRRVAASIGSTRPGEGACRFVVARKNR